MRTLVVLICSLALALVSTGAQEEKGKKKEQKKGAQAGQVSSWPGKPAGKAVQARKTVPVKQPSDFGKVKNTGNTVGSGEFGGAPGTPRHGKKAEVRKAKETSKPTTTGKPMGGPSPIAAVKSGKAGVVAGKPLKPQHFDLPKQPNIAKAPAVKFQQGRHIEGSEHWQGQQYAVFRNYHSEWHDQGWWHNHYHNNITFVFGAPYYFNAGYWFPAWGYYPNAYYAWDGPIYAYHRLPPDQVIANVQSTLQQQGYYQGDVDGLVGPLTRAALADYQRDHGLYETAAIDRPTLESLGMT
jgi:hypothetical protein